MKTGNPAIVGRTPRFDRVALDPCQRRADEGAGRGPSGPSQDECRKAS